MVKMAKVESDVYIHIYTYIYIHIYCIFMYIYIYLYIYFHSPAVFDEKNIASITLPETNRQFAPTKNVPAIHFQMRAVC